MFLACGHWKRNMQSDFPRNRALRVWQTRRVIDQHQQLTKMSKSMSPLRFDAEQAGFPGNDGDARKPVHNKYLTAALVAINSRAPLAPAFGLGGRRS